MVIGGWIIAVVAVTAVPILLMRFRRRWVAKFNLSVVVHAVLADWRPRIFGSFLIASVPIGSL
jgi:predicted cobalt transporter CbtA